ncbi:MAG: ADP-ribosylglycohydrolase family protein, partial [Akkermansiaceae bacterium]|nr:ADP-ribosylglycohydrolase family protein [Verrucomicrobiales bacterium]
MTSRADLTLTREQYVDRVNAIWHAQMIAVFLTLPYEHKMSAVEPVRGFPKPMTHASVDDDWYYEMAAVRGFETFGIGMTADELGKKWVEHNCGTWGSSSFARLQLLEGIKGSESGHPRYNPFWWTIGPVFSAELYGALAPGMPNEAARMARQYGHVNGYAEAVDGGVILAGAISLGFVESDPRKVLKKAVKLVDPSSPYRQCVESVIKMAEEGRSFEEVVHAVEDRWRRIYPQSNNAVPNGGIAAAIVWFGEGDFWKIINLAASAADFTDVDNNAAGAVAVLAAMKGMAALPPELVAQFGDRMIATNLGSLTLTPPVDESISGLARRTAAIGEKIALANGGSVKGDRIKFKTQTPRMQPAERFELANLMRYWNPDWTLERAGFSGPHGGTYLKGDELITFPCDEVRALVMRRTLKLGDSPSLGVDVAAEEGQFWELNVAVGNDLIHKQVIISDEPGTVYHPIHLDLLKYAGREVTIRLFQKAQLDWDAKKTGKPPGA